MSGFNYKTGNIISKEEAIVQLKVRAVESAPSGLSFDIKLGRYDGKPAILASDINTPEYFISTFESRIPLVASTLTINEFGVAVEAPNFVPLNDSEFANADKEFTGTRFVFDGQYFIALEGFEAGVVSQQVLEYVPETDQFRNLLTGAIYTDNGRGNYALVDDKSVILEPGWRAPIWFENYVNIVSDPRVREPLIRVFIWTVVFALLTVLTTFALGLLLALALNKPIHGRRIYRSILVLPYAMPSVMSILIWGGMFNTEFGAINALLGTDIAWFSDPNFARVAVILVNLWLGFPYFYLISSGSLQAIPSELLEAAAIDGASPLHRFRTVIFPLLSPTTFFLLVINITYAFFDTFGIIDALTKGGPGNATQTLIYRAYIDGRVNLDLGSSSAQSVVLMIAVMALTFVQFRFIERKVHY
jgi:arabinogalactan oligomer/maltooligosaccharide transport system permease protein